MKKITLIACAALVAGFLMSCSSEAGVKDYNNVTTTSTYNSYVVKGTIATTVETSSKRFNDENKQTNGSSSSITTTERIVSTPAYVTFGTDENFDGNYAKYTISIDDSKGFSSEVANSATYWDSAAKEEKKATAAEIKDYNDAHKETDEPNETISVPKLSLIVIDDVIYYESNGERFVVTADAEKIAEGESFDLDVTFVTDDTSSNKTYYDSDGDQDSRNESADKTSVTYKFSFTAK